MTSYIKAFTCPPFASRQGLRCSTAAGNKVCLAFFFPGCQKCTSLCAWDQPSVTLSQLWRKPNLHHQMWASESLSSRPGWLQPWNDASEYFSILVSDPASSVHFDSLLNAIGMLWITSLIRDFPLYLPLILCVMAPPFSRARWSCLS